MRMLVRFVFLLVILVAFAGCNARTEKKGPIEEPVKKVVPAKPNPGEPTPF